MAVLDQRRAGILLHITSLYKPWGHGDLGDCAYQFVAFLRKWRLSVWQVLPIHPLSNPADLSPYQPQSVHAGNPLLISLEWFQRDDHRWLHPTDVPPPKNNLSVSEVATYRYQKLRKAYSGFKQVQYNPYLESYERFKSEQAHWLEDYALFRALKQKNQGEPWFDWKPHYRDREKLSLQQARIELAEDIDYCCFEQFIFFQQWQELQQYAHKNGVYLFGDMPFFAALDSSDVWANRNAFLLNKTGMPEFVAGDRPSEVYPEGQCWGNPLYRWNTMQADGFAWWKARFRTAHRLFDLIRLTHFRGFVECYAVPMGSRKAAEGHLEKSPGNIFFNALKLEFPQYASQWIAEDIGTWKNHDGGEIVQLRKSFKIMGMKLLQLAFYYKPYSDQLDLGNRHLPHHHRPEYVVYSGNHDSQTVRGWFNNLDAKRRDYVRRYLQITQESDELWYFIETVFKSCAKLAIIPMQDILGLDNSARMNDPKHSEATNWVWRYNPSQIDEMTNWIRRYNSSQVNAAKETCPTTVEEKLAELTERYERM